MFRVEALTPMAAAPKGKFVLLRQGDDLHFVSAPLATHSYHANIVFDFVQEQGRGKAVLLSGTHCTILSPGWKVLGGGHYALDKEARVLRLSEKSTAFGKYPVETLRPFADTLKVELGLSGFDLTLL